MENSQKIFVAIGTVAIVGLAAFGGKLLLTGGGAASSGAPVVASNTSTQLVGQPSASNAATTYKNGQYTATQGYYVPHGGSNSVVVTLTVNNGSITAVNTVNQSNDRESQLYINDFENAVKANADGQALNSYAPSRIGGASLTTEAFAQALNAIKTEAAG